MVNIIVLTITILIYLIPTFISYRRNHQNKVSILVLNILLGWTVVGWVISLVWSLMKVNNSSYTGGDVDKKCPFCAETIKKEAKICRYCNKEQEVEQEKIIEDTKEQSKSTIQDKIKVFKNSNGKLIKYFSISITVLSVLLFLMGVYAFIQGIIQSKIFVIVYAIILVLSGLLLYFRNSIVKDNKELIDKKSLNNKSTYLGLISLDLVVTQFVLMILIIIFHNNIYINLSNLVLIINNNTNHVVAYFLAFICFILGVVLIRKGNRFFGVITSIVCLSYIISPLLTGNVDVQQDSLHTAIKSLEEFLSRPTFIINIYPYLSLLVLSVAFPFVQLLQIDGLKYGKVLGDLKINIKHHEVFLAFGSAFVFSIIWYGVLIFSKYSWDYYRYVMS